MDEDIFRKLEERLGPLHARQRLGIETDHEAQIFGQGLLFFHIGNWYPVHSVIRNALKLTGLYWRGRRNTERILVKRNDVMFKELPPLFDGFTILHLSDMHVDMNGGAMRRLIELVGGMRYDLCVLTGDYRGKTSGKASSISRIASREYVTDSYVSRLLNLALLAPYLVEQVIDGNPLANEIARRQMSGQKTSSLWRRQTTELSAKLN